MKTQQTFQIGQCWTSEGEPELGIGFVKALDETSIAIEYPSAAQARLYRKKHPPLRRLEFRAGEKIQSKAGTSLLIEKVELREGLIWYVGPGDLELCESDLSPKLTLQRPMERFLAGHWDSLSAFTLRRRSLEYHQQLLRSPARGMIGPKAQLLPHQLYVTHEICRRGLPRALLADDVGLGKTIEAGWIMHRLLLTGRIRRVLIIVPESLVNQWFVELFKRFNLSFWVPASQTDEELEAEDIAEQERVILSLESITALHQREILNSADWDLVVVDEAHRITWDAKRASPEYELISELARKSPGLLLLTATPEQLGLEGHFSRLHLIDPHRFASLDKFEKEHQTYLEIVRLADQLLSHQVLSKKDSENLKEMLGGKISPQTLAQLDQLDEPEARRAILLALIDHYGTGRIYFRNSRSVVELEHCSFPKRHLTKHTLQTRAGETVSQSMVRWLGEFAQAHRTEKALLICSSAKKVIEWERKLRDEYALKVVAFHEELSLLARDRNAAYFEDPAGASILLCSEIGGEGRNFQHASHLILADLPQDPDVLEQRIGRLDRIGQASDISIHVPCFEKSPEQRLLRWHEEVFQAFRAPPRGAAAVYTEHRDALSALQEKSATQATDKAFEILLTTAKKDYQNQLKKIEAGRDRLIEINSFDPVKGPQLAQVLEASERSAELREYLEALLDALGMHSDDLDSDSIFVEPGHGQYVSYFSGLPPEGLSFTFSRKKALARNDLALMTWDHPMIHDTLISLVGQEFGNVCVAAWNKPLLAIECSFVLEPAATAPVWHADEFFPKMPIRIVLEATGKDLTSELDWESLRQALNPLSPAAAALVKKLPGERIRGVLNKALSQAQARSQSLKSQALTQMNQSIDEEVARLQSFQKKNALVSELELDWWKQRKAHLQNAFDGAQVRLDSFLLVVPSQLGT